MFLKLLPQLKLAYQEAGVLEAAQPFIEALQGFKEVVKDCFGMELQEGYEAKLLTFRELYRALPISVTPKVSYITINGHGHICICAAS